MPVRGGCGLAVSGSSGGFVLLDHAGGNPATVADRDALISRPRPNTTVALTTRCAALRPAARSPDGLAGVFGERDELLVKDSSVPGAQVDLVVSAVQRTAPSGPPVHHQDHLTARPLSSAPSRPPDCQPATPSPHKINYPGAATPTTTHPPADPARCTLPTRPSASGRGSGPTNARSAAE